MVYGKRTMRSRRPIRRRRRAPIKRYVRRKISKITRAVELKWFDDQDSVDSVDATGAIGCFNAVPGIGQVSNNNFPLREGREIRMTSVQLNISLTTPPISFDEGVSSAPENYIRFIVFWDRSPQGLLPDLTGSNISSLLDGNSPLAQNTPPVWQFRNYMTIKRYTILYDKVFRIYPRAAAAATSSGETPDTTYTYTYNQVYLKKRFRLSRAVKFNRQAGGTESINANGLYFAVVGNHQPESSEPDTDLRVSSRVYYKDS